MMMGTKLKALALRLYSLAEKDRQWILNNLSQEERKKILALLNEIRVKGLTTDSSIIKETIEEYNHAGSATSGDSDELDDYIKQVDKLDEEKLLPVLMKDDAWIIALLLETYDWRWRESLEKQLSANQKIQCKQYQQKDLGKIKPDVKMALLKILSELNFSEKLEATGAPAGFNFEASLQSQNHRNLKRQKRWWKAIWR